MHHDRPLIYLDNAATSWPKPPSVYDFMMEFYRSTGVSPGRSGFELAIEAGTLLDRLRLRLTRFFGGDADTPERLCFGYNATDALNLIIPGLVAAGDHIVTTELEHNSVIRPVNHLVRDGGVTATFVPFDGAGFVDPDDIARAIRPNTRLVVINHGSNVIGTVQPLGAIGRVCRERGVPLVVDASQTAGVVPIDMRAMHIDALVFTGHKALFGSTGIGGVCVRKHLDVRQVRAGGTGVHSEYPYHLTDYPWRLEYGTVNMLGVASLWAGQDWIEQQGLAAIHARELELTQRLVAVLLREPARAHLHGVRERHRPGPGRCGPAARRQAQHRHAHRPAVRAAGARAHRHAARARHGALLDRCLQHRGGRGRGDRGHGGGGGVGRGALARVAAGAGGGAGGDRLGRNRWRAAGAGGYAGAGAYGLIACYLT
jgi:selenocysteine lyase/cysteine desulfurase